MMFMILTLLLLAGTALLIWCRFFETSRLEITRQQWPPNINAPGDTLRVVQFSDLHLQRRFPAARLTAIVDQINQLQPDVVVYTGDFFDNVRFYRDTAEAARQLNRLSCSRRFAIWGNHDRHDRRSAKLAKEALTAGGFTLLENKAVQIDLNGINLQIIGLDELVYGRPAVPAGLLPADFSLLLVHEPDLAFFPDIPYDLALTGHSHGGQINLSFLPFYSRLKLPFAHNMHFLAGFYKNLYVNRGLGYTHLPLRLASRPEITVFEISCKNENPDAV